MSKHLFKSNHKINRVEVTSDTLSGRGGLALFVRYLHGINIYGLVCPLFPGMRKSNKGLPLWNLFKQVLCFFFDGTSRHLTYFDQLSRDPGYAAVIENDSGEMASSHQVKRFFNSFPQVCAWPFRKLLKHLFIWRLKLEKPAVIELMIDTMVMDNDDAKKRDGVQPTYKKVLGFQPLQIIWNGKVIDGIFRGGKKNGDCGDTVVNMVTALVRLIRMEYGDVPIILRLDSGFFGEKNFAAFDKLNIAFICAGKMYDSVKDHVKSAPEKLFGTYDNGHQRWTYLEWNHRCDIWAKGREYRTIYTRPLYEDKQSVLDFARPDGVVLTNIGVHPAVTARLGGEHKKTECIIQSNHGRGADELAHRGLKDFGFEELPFKHFAPNTALYYCMLIAFFLFETFKEDVLSKALPEGIPATSYATTVRRKAVDCAVKIVRAGGQIVLKVTTAVMESLRFDKLWALCQNPPPIHA
jgi:Transposase DDE domain group 1